MTNRDGACEAQHGTSAEESLLVVDRVSFSYERGAQILRDVSMNVQRGEVLTLLGPNGSGKSTLLNCLSGLLDPQEGSVLLNGKDIKVLQPRQIASTIAYVRQSHEGTFAFLVRDYVAMGRAPHMGMFTKLRKEDLEVAEQALDLLGVSHLAMRAYTELSGGQRQLVDICRAIAQEPQLILFDEPTSALDYGNQLRVVNLMIKLADEGYGVIMTTHNPDHAILLGGKVAILDREGDLEYGPLGEILDEARLSRLYQTDLRIVDVDEVGRIACLSPGIRNQRKAGL